MAAMFAEPGFWLALDSLVSTHPVIVDRPRGSTHTAYPEICYPLDYGYLEGTRAADGSGIDVWLGSETSRNVTGIICTIDVGKGDAEVKVLLGCTPQEARQVLVLHNVGLQSAILIERAAPSGGVMAPCPISRQDPAQVSGRETPP
jgi:inorganic pyrophosphatase